MNYCKADTFVTDAQISRQDLLAQLELTHFSRQLAGLQLATPSLKWEMGGLGTKTAVLCGGHRAGALFHDSEKIV